MMARKNWSIILALGIITLLGLGLHAYRISWPSSPVFDEAHFATYAADYVKDQTFFDIHPPLGKLIYAAAIKIAHPAPLGTMATDFVAFAKNPGPNDPKVFATGIAFGSFPYVPLRAVSVAFGLLLPLVVYWFLRNIGISQVGALLAAFFITFENAFLLETKLILLNGMYLVFGFAALACWFRKPRWGIAAGILLGLSLGVKLIGIVFLIPIIIGYFLTRGHGEQHVRARRELWKMFAAAAIVFFLITLTNFIFFSPTQIIAFFKSIGIGTAAPRSATASSLFSYTLTTIVSWSGYLVGSGQLFQSPWYFWPLMQIPMPYYGAVVDGTLRSLVLEGNPIVWFGSTFAVILGIAILPRYIKEKMAGTMTEAEKGEWCTTLILLGGYVGSLVPFFTIVQRSTFLYHYFPAYLFAIGFLSWMLSRWLKLGRLEDLSKQQWLMLMFIALAVIAGFLAMVKTTYGL